MTNKREHISYSELKDWAHCPYYHKKAWIEKVAPFEGNEYTAFGSAIHDVCEKKLLKEDIDEAEVFQLGFAKRIQDLLEKNIAFDAVLPKSKIILGLIISICLFKKGKYLWTSLSVGFLFSGGR